MEGIQVSTEVAGSRNQISIIKVGGYIDTTTSSELERALDSLLKQGRFFLIVDLGNVDYISSAGWGIFISEIKSIRENGGDLKLVRMVPDVYEIFELLEFHHILDVYDSVDEAINKFEMLETTGKPAMKDVMPSRPEPAPRPQQASPQPAMTAQVETLEESPVETELDEASETMPAELPLAEKIKLIVRKNPNLGAFKIKRELNSVNFGFMKVSWKTVRGELNKMGLGSKSKRYQFAMNSR